MNMKKAIPQVDTVPLEYSGYSENSLRIEQQLTDERLKIGNVRKALLLVATFAFLGLLTLFIKMDVYEKAEGTIHVSSDTIQHFAPFDFQIAELMKDNFSLVKPGEKILSARNQELDYKLELLSSQICLNEFLTTLYTQLKSQRLDINKLTFPEGCQALARQQAREAKALADKHQLEIEKLLNEMTLLQLSLEETSSYITISRIEVEITKDKLDRYMKLENDSIATEAEIFEYQKKLDIAKERIRAAEKETQKFNTQLDRINLEIESSKVDRSNYIESSLRQSMQLTNEQKAELKSLRALKARAEFTSSRKGYIRFSRDLLPGATIFKGDELFVVSNINSDNFEVIAFVTAEAFSQTSINSDVLVRFPRIKTVSQQVFNGKVISKQLHNTGALKGKNIFQLVIRLTSDSLPNFKGSIVSGDIANIKVLLRSETVLEFLFKDIWSELKW